MNTNMLLLYGLFGVMPTVLAIAVAVSSVMVAYRTRHIMHFAVSAIVIGGVAWSLMVLYSIIVMGAWPSYLPYLVIGILLVVVVAQILIYRSRRDNETAA